MFNEQLARDLAAIARVGGASTENVLQQITAVTVRGIPGCSGGAAQLWHEDLVVQSVASHSGLTLLLERERSLGSGASLEALYTREQVVVHDFMWDTRWEAYARAAIRYGIRSVIVIPFEVEQAMVTLGLYAVRPHAFAGRPVGPFATLLAEQFRVALHNANDYEGAVAEALQMQEALSTRAEIDQAKGILMQARGYDAKTAFEELRRVSQHHQVKVAEVARRLVEEHEHKHQDPRPRT